MTKPRFFQDVSSYNEKLYRLIEGGYDASSKERYAAIMIDLELFAHSLSDDPKTKVGAMYVDFAHQFTAPIGANHYPEGVTPLPDKSNITHAEVDVLDKLGNYSVGKDGTLFVTKASCVNCARAICRKGIKHVVTPVIYTPSDWEVSQREALSLFEQSGVTVTLLEYEFIRAFKRFLDEASTLLGGG